MMFRPLQMMCHEAPLMFPGARLSHVGHAAARPAAAALVVITAVVPVHAGASSTSGMSAGASAAASAISSAAASATASAGAVLRLAWAPADEGGG
jgi:hypothetical protein